MTCDLAGERLDEYVQGGLAEAEFQELELHLAGCASCREEERELRALLADVAALPRELRPGRDLWAGIEERLQPRGRLLAFPWRGSLPLGLAAAAGVVLTLAAVLFMGRGQGPQPAPAGVAQTVSSPGSAGLEEVEAEYARAAAALLGALESRRDSLDPDTLASVEASLASIDGALSDVRQALRRDPGNRQLTAMLASTHKKKVDVLRRVVRLTSL
jgi:hypothetical protein